MGLDYMAKRFVEETGKNLVLSFDGSKWRAFKDGTSTTFHSRVGRDKPEDAVLDELNRHRGGAVEQEGSGI